MPNVLSQQISSPQPRTRPAIEHRDKQGRASEAAISEDSVAEDGHASDEVGPELTEKVETLGAVREWSRSTILIAVIFCESCEIPSRGEICRVENTVEHCRGEHCRGEHCRCMQFRPRRPDEVETD